MASLFFSVLAIVLGLVFVVIVAAALLLLTVGALDDRVSGVARLEGELKRGPHDPRLVELFGAELRDANGGGLVWAILFILLGVPGLAWGAHEHYGMFRPEPDEWLPYLVPGAFLTLIGLGLIVRRVNCARLEHSGAYVALIGRAPEAVSLSISHIPLSLDTPDLAASPTREEKLVLAQVPHVVVHYRDDSTYQLRSFDDESWHETMSIVQRMLPQASVTST